jgi:hypothetical protein
MAKCAYGFSDDKRQFPVINAGLAMPIMASKLGARSASRPLAIVVLA